MSSRWATCDPGSVKRVAAGVGEGGMAIAFVHQYLALQQREGAQG